MGVFIEFGFGEVGSIGVDFIRVAADLAPLDGQGEGDGVLGR